MTGPLPTRSEQPKVPHSTDSQWALANALVNWKKNVSPLLNKAYRTEDYEQRVALAKEALPWAEGLAAAVRYAATPPEEGTPS